MFKFVHSVKMENNPGECAWYS